MSLSMVLIAHSLIPGVDWPQNQTIELKPRTPNLCKGVAFQVDEHFEFVEQVLIGQYWRNTIYSTSVMFETQLYRCCILHIAKWY